VAEGLGQPNVLFAGTGKLELRLLLTTFVTIFHRLACGTSDVASGADEGHAFATAGVASGPLVLDVSSVCWRPRDGQEYSNGNRVWLRVVFRP
jgi:hypothetical protein